MPLDVLGRTRATLMHSTSLARPRGPANLLNLHRDGDRLLQLLIFNEEFLVSACHQRALITSLPFVHTARRSYRLNDPVRPPDCGNAAGSPAAMPREAVQTLSFRGRRSRNKVSVGEPAEGSLPVFPPPTLVRTSMPLGGARDALVSRPLRASSAAAFGAWAPPRRRGRLSLRDDSSPTRPSALGRRASPVRRRGALGPSPVARLAAALRRRAAPGAACLLVSSH
jgi:hypothetical protein